MALTDTLPTQDSGGLSIADERLIYAGEYVTSTAGIPRLGILPSHTNAVVTGLASMAYSVAAFVGVVSRTGGATAEKIANNGATTVTTTAAPGSNSRIDVIWVRPQFVASADAGNVPLFGVTQGSASASPTKPSIPAGALELATAVIPSTATTTTSSGVVITQTFLYTAFEGGTVLLRSQAEQDAWAPHDGSPAYRLDTGKKITRVGGVWLADRGLFLARRANTQSLGVSGWHGLSAAFGPADINELGTWTPANGTLQVARAGLYRVGLNVRLQNASSPMAMQITQNSGSPDVGVLVDSFVNAQTTSLSASGVVVLAANDVIRGLVYTSVANSIDAIGTRGLQLSVELLQYT